MDRQIMGEYVSFILVQYLKDKQFGQRLRVINPINKLDFNNLRAITVSERGMIICSCHSKHNVNSKAVKRYRLLFGV